MTIGERLREERERMGLSQPKFAALAGTTKQTLFSWESGKTAPDGFQLAALDAAGADVRYIITGDRDAPPPPVLSPDEHVLLDGYRGLDKKTQKRLLAFVLGGELATGSVGQQINAPVKGGVAGRDLVHKGRKNKDEAGDQR